MAKKRQKRVLFLGIISLVFLYPVIYMLICSVWEGKNAGVSMMGYYRVLLESPGYLVKFWRSLGMCLLIAGGQTILACMAGTAFAKYRFIGKKFWLAMMALFMILPVQVTLLPNYILMEKLGFLNSWKSLIIPGIFSPFGTVWLTFIFQSIPDEWLEAARLDRANQLQIVRYIVVPAAKPAVVTLFVLTFVEHGGTADYFPGGRTGLSTFRFSGGCDGKQHDGSVCVRTFVSASGDILLPVLS